MKQVLLALTFIIAGFISNAQSRADEVVKFNELKFNFGKIKQGVPVEHAFQFVNKGERPVIIENAMASCGCTTPSWPQQPVMKGKSSAIKAGFNAQAIGPFDKTIIVKVKGFDLPIEIRITGEVVPENKTKLEDLRS